MEQADMIRMANQIAGFFKNYGPEEGKKEIAAHLNNFWEPRMRKQLFRILSAGGNGLDPLVIEASQLVRRPTDHVTNQAHLPKHGEES